MKYSGKTITVPMDIEKLYDRVADVNGYQALIDQVPDNLRDKLQGVHIVDGAIVFPAPGLGEITLKQTVAERPKHVEFAAQNSPLPLALVLDFAPAAEGKTELTPSIDAQLPPMLAPMVGGKLKDASDMLGQTFANIFSK